MFRRLVPSLMPLLVFNAVGCHPDGENWATFEVSGTVSNSQSQLVAGTEVRVRTWAPNDCGSPAAWQLATTSTDRNGRYRVRLTSLTSSYTACIRVMAASVSRDTTVIDKPAIAPVEVNLLVP
jgi:hypothetical protein